VRQNVQVPARGHRVMYLEGTGRFNDAALVDCDRCSPLA
jgi:hypothetical protein